MKTTTQTPLIPNFPTFVTFEYDGDAHNDIVMISGVRPKARSADDKPWLPPFHNTEEYLDTNSDLCEHVEYLDLIGHTYEIIDVETFARGDQQITHVGIERPDTDEPDQYLAVFYNCFDLEADQTVTILGAEELQALIEFCKARGWTWGTDWNDEG
jgi:hypothetical protein